MGHLEGKSIVITGAGRGLGRSFAIDAAREGASVVVNDIDEAEAQAVVREITDAGGAAFADGSNVADWEQSSHLIESCVERFGSLDGLVNNAAVFYTSPPWDEEEANLRRIVEANVLGVMFTGAHAARQMREQGFGSLLNVTSGAHIGISRMGAYGATKGAVASITYSWALDLSPLGIRVNAISPRATTRMADVGRAAGTSFSSVSPDLTAPLVTFLMSDLSAGITGQIVRLDEGSLTLVAHPKILPNPESAAGWTVESIAAAFDRSLRSRLEPVGLSAKEYVWGS